MSPRAYYNEIDPHAAQWLRNLISAGHIAPGDVDQRSIEDVRPADLMGYTQCHFFAGIGIWSYSLRQAGWPDERAVWTGSCPCQPFSTAGKGAGLADERHLWPSWFHLIEQAKPGATPVFGEQVANGDGLTWLDLVSADMEGAGYAFRALDLCAAGFGAPHIRQRLFFHAARPADGLGDTGHEGLEGQPRDGDNGHQPGWIGAGEAGHAAQAGAVDGMADTGHGEHMRRDAIRDAEGEHGREAGAGEGAGAERERQVDDAAVRGPGCWLANATGKRSGSGLRDQGPGEERRPEPSDDRSDERLSHPEVGGQREQRSEVVEGEVRHPDGGHPELGRPGPVNGRWAAADWLWCRDHKFRPVEPGTFPLVDGASSRVVRLRAYGNGIVSEVATEFIKSCMNP